MPNWVSKQKAQRPNLRESLALRRTAAEPLLVEIFTVNNTTVVSLYRRQEIRQEGATGFFGWSQYAFDLVSAPAKSGDIYHQFAIGTVPVAPVAR
jgi:hypothetical protein